MRSRAATTLLDAASCRIRNSTNKVIPTPTERESQGQGSRENVTAASKVSSARGTRCRGAAVDSRQGDDHRRRLHRREPEHRQRPGQGEPAGGDRRQRVAGRRRYRSRLSAATRAASHRITATISGDQPAVAVLGVLHLAGEHHRLADDRSERVLLGVGVGRGLRWPPWPGRCSAAGRRRSSGSALDASVCCRRPASPPPTAAAWCRGEPAGGVGPHRRLPARARSRR